MAAITISTSEQTLLDTLATEKHTAFKDGVNKSTGAEYLPPTDGYSSLFLPGSTEEAAALDSYRLENASLIRRVGPIAFGTTVTSLALTVGSFALQLASVSFTPFKISRNVIVNASGSAWSSGTSVGLEFYLVYGSNTSTKCRYFFNESSSHRTFNGSWCISLPSDVGSIALMVARYVGTDVINFDANDSVSLTVVG